MSNEEKEEETWNFFLILSAPRRSCELTIKNHEAVHMQNYGENIIFFLLLKPIPGMIMFM